MKKVTKRPDGSAEVLDEREASSGELEKQDLVNRLAALEAEAKTRNPTYKIPDPPPGYQRVK